MHILEINDFPGVYGGAERHFLSLCRLLEQRGHRVTRFHSMEHYEKGKIRAVKESFRQVLDADRYDIAHVHILDHKFLFLLKAISSRSIKIVQTLHDHRAICFNGTMYSKGKICEKCKGNKYYWANVRGCIHTFMALCAFIKRGIFQVSEYDEVDLFISPSDFLRENFKAWGFRGEIVKLRNFLDMEEYVPDNGTEKNSIAYFGRLSCIKGLHTLLSAMKGLPLHLNVIGTGELKNELEERIKREHLENVTLMGYKAGKELRQEIQDSLFVVVPSECYENSPYAVMEAFAMAKPILGSNLGGIAELVGNEERGMLFAPGNVGELREKILFLLKHRDIRKKLGKAGRAYAEEHFSIDLFYNKLMELFSGVIGKDGGV